MHPKEVGLSTSLGLPSPPLLFPPRGTRLHIQALRRRYFCQASSFYVLFPPTDTSVTIYMCTHVRSMYVRIYFEITRKLTMMLIFLKYSNSKLWGKERKTLRKYISVIFIEFYWKWNITCNIGNAYIYIYD